MPVVGNTIRELWKYLDGNGDPVGGMTSPADVLLELFRDSGSGMVAASEVVTWAAVAGEIGFYTISFSPENSGKYVLLLKELNADSFFARHEYRYEVTAAGAVFAPTYSNAFCAESDVERWTQVAIDASSSPTDTQTAAFAEARAAILMSLCAGLGFSVTPSTVVAGSRLEDMLREANSIGAALDWVSANEHGVSPSLSEKAERLAILWTEYVGGPKPGFVTETKGWIEKEVRQNLASLSSDHILSGDTLAYPSGSAPTSEPIGIGMGSLF